MTQVDACEDEREMCDLINITGVSNLIKAIGNRNTHFVHISTDFIYEGDEEEYFEDSKVNPLVIMEGQNGSLNNYLSKYLSRILY